MNLDDAVRLGTSLRRIDPALLKNGAASAWFKGGEPYFDVFLELAPATGTIEWFQVTLRGRSLTWRPGQRLQTGSTDEYQLSTGLPQSKTIADDSQVDAELVQLVRALLGAQPNEPLLCAARDLLG